MKINILDLDRSETVDILKESDLFLFPSNIEASPIVLFEAIASRTPFLASDVGNSKEIARWTGGGKILPTTKDKNGYSHAEIEKSAKDLVRLYGDQKLRDEMSKNGFESWRKKFSWGKITEQYLALYREVL